MAKHNCMMGSPLALYVKEIEENKESEADDLWEEAVLGDYHKHMFIDDEHENANACSQNSPVCAA